MKKSAFHFKIASWSCRYPSAFYAISVCLLLLFTGIVVVSVRSVLLNKVASPITQSITTNAISYPADWTPVKDMDLPDGIKCRLYKRAGTSITNCYKFSNGEWAFYQSF